MSFARLSVTRGTVLTVAMRWTDRLIGLVSTIILARLLAPDDIGVIAMATLVIALADVLLDLGVNIALIRNRDATQAHFDTAWTLRLIQTTLSTLILFLAAPMAADYFQDARVELVLRILAFTLLLSGLENIGIIDFHKAMQFGAEFRFLFLRRIAGFLITMVAAWTLRSYWALVIGTLATRGIGVGLSYWMHPMRPRLSLAKLREILGVSQWLLLRGIGEFLLSNLHRILVGRWAPTSTLGAYTLANEIATMPSAELLAPMNRALFPALAEAGTNSPELKRLFLLAQGLQTLLAIPAAVGLALVAGEVVAVLLGDQWHEAVPLLQLLALMGVVQALTATSGYLLLVLGRLAEATGLIWIQVMLFAILALALCPGGSAIEIAALRLTAAVVAVGLTIWLLLRVLPVLRLAEFIAVIYRPVLGALLMALSIVAVDALSEQPPVILLAFKILVGFLVYLAVILFAWRLSRCPAGAESWLLDKVRTAQMKRRKDDRKFA
ncbi:lipopolysaccharide biosynthesis protein [Allochromatium vinosum]|uniref:Polysaccharide biosynthesis protein n=1 Tax=Allochromatium vinosum (strain ATCC 17899 / DSM 180 / NBRC 103801 / NCIMB 10441 / D) TaxID=572477 RepID=D3RU68_ALLVD|nr:lipopolysaccharide biosynthesis protein [Allochromatium vinosum]ADC62727.1 polysaccharide biosynthesis protein [Allochromatium vinosum DSM 180]